MYRQWVPCEHNSSYNFIPIFLKLCTCFLHGLKMCMWFGYNPCINFCCFFHIVNFVIFWPQILLKCIDSEYLVSATPHTILYWSFWNFAHVFSMVLRCECGLDIILELIFITFFTLWTLSFSDLRFYGYLVSATPYTISVLSSCNFAHLFSMCMWFGFNPAVNFCHISTLLTLSFFNFSQVQHQLHRSSIYILIIMPPTSKKLQEHIGFRLGIRVCVRPCIRSSKTVHARVLKFHIWISHGKIVDAQFFSCPSYLPF